MKGSEHSIFTVTGRGGGGGIKVLLTIAPGVHHLEIYRVTGMKAPPLGLASMAAVLEQAGHSVRILDSPTLGLDLEDWMGEVASWGPDMIGFSVLTPLAPKTYDAIARVKERFPDVPVVVGGPHPTFMYEEALERGSDIVVLGEGEPTILEVADAVEKHGLNPGVLSRVRGIAFRESGGVKVTPMREPVRDLDSLPWPARHLLPMDKYTLFGKPIRIAHVMASRGCPYGCVYCTTSYFWGRRVRFRSARNVADEVEYLADKYGVKYVVFSDDELLMNRRFVRDYIKEMKERGLDLPFACGARVDHLSRSIMKELVDNNCVTIYVGVESASQETIDRIGKRITVDQVRRVFEWKREVGAYIVASFILGFPWETLEDMEETISFAVKLDPDYAQFTALTPYPGTPLFEYAKSNGLIEDWDWEHYTTIRPVMRGFNFTREQLGRMVTKAYRRFYLRLSFVRRAMSSGSFTEILRILAREASRYLADVVAYPLQWRVRR